MMVETMKSWLEERRAIHAKAELKAKCESNRGFVSTAWAGTADEDGPIDDREAIAESWPEGGAAIADAMNSLPATLNMIEAVLDLHKPSPEIPGVCEECSALAEEVPLFTSYPCATVQAMEEAKAKAEA